MAKPTLVVVTDDPGTLTAATQALERRFVADYQVVAADAPAAALTALGQAALDAIARSSMAALDKPWASRHPHRHWRRRRADPLRPPPILRCQRIWLGVIVLLADDRLKRLPAS